MQRELKFRAWDNKRKRFVGMGEIVFSDYGETTIEVVPNSQAYIGDEVHDGEPQRGRFVVEQFTGIQDKDGKDIYEGDLLDYGYGRILEMRFHDGAFKLGIVKTLRNKKLVSCDWGELPINPRGKEVVGNIHENPELLKEAAENPKE